MKEEEVKEEKVWGRYSDEELEEFKIKYLSKKGFLNQLFDEFKIQERLVKLSDFDPPHGNWGALYPLPAGIIQAGGIKRDMVSSSVITASGKEEILEAIYDFLKGNWNTDYVAAVIFIVILCFSGSNKILVAR